MGKTRLYTQIMFFPARLHSSLPSPPPPPGIVHFISGRFPRDFGHIHIVRSFVSVTNIEFSSLEQAYASGCEIARTEGKEGGQRRENGDGFANPSISIFGKGIEV